MIVICIEENWYTDATMEHAKRNNIVIGDWSPIVDGLYEVIDCSNISSTVEPSNAKADYYHLREDPIRTRCWRSTHFREVDINIEDIAIAVPEELELTS
jgi:hypothetical protein